MKNSTRHLCAWAAALALTICCLLLCVRVLTGKGAAPAASLPAPPDHRLPHCLVNVRYIRDEGVLAVTQTWQFMLAGASGTDDIRFYAPAGAYSREDTSPAAVRDLFEAAYGDAFSPGMLLPDSCFVDQTPARVTADPDDPSLLIVHRAVEPGRTVTAELRFRLILPKCAHRFGIAGEVVRAVRVLPELCQDSSGQWVVPDLPCYGDGPLTRICDVTYRASLPEGFTMLTGALKSVTGPAFLIVPDSFSRSTVRAGSMSLTLYAGDERSLSAAAGQAQQLLNALCALYGPLADAQLTAVLCPYTDTGLTAPGLTVLCPDQSGKVLPGDMAYWLAGQWTDRLLPADGLTEAWLGHALRQWSALRAISRAYGANAADDLKRAVIDSSMRENLLARLTPGMRADVFPSQALFRTVMDGRGGALMYALDTYLSGRLDELILSLMRSQPYEPLTGDAVKRAAQRLSMGDPLPLFADYLDTYINEGD